MNIATKDLQAVVPGITRSQLESAIIGTSGNFITVLPQAKKDMALDAIVGALRKL